MATCPKCKHDESAAGPAGICVGCPCEAKHGRAAHWSATAIGKMESMNAAEGEGRESLSFVEKGRFVWTDGVSLLWGETTERSSAASVPASFRRKVNETIAGALSARVLRRVGFDGIDSAGAFGSALVVLVDGRPFDALRVMHAAAALDGVAGAVDLALMDTGRDDDTKALVMRCGERGALVMGRLPLRDLLALPEAP